jgi:hypothetical protein
MKKRILFLILFLPLTALCTLEYPTNKADSIKEMNYREQSSYSTGLIKYNHTKFETSIAAEQDLKRCNQAQADYGVSYYGYYAESFNYTKSLFEWQLRSTKVIFFVVISLVLCGLAFSGIQFYTSMKLIQHQVALGTFKFSPQGVEVTSTVMGLIILVISIVFFFLYLTVVYPINDVKLDGVPRVNTEVAKEQF